MNIWLYFILITTAMSVLAKPVLTVYTYDSFSSEWGPGPAIKTAFENEYDCKLQFIALKDGVAILNRLRLEGEKNQADIVLGLDNNLLQAARNTGLFTPHTIVSKSITLPGGWYDNLFLPYDYGYFAFIYDKSKLKNPPRSLHELVDYPAPLKIIYEDPRTSTPGFGFLLWVQKVYGDSAPAAWKKLAAKTVTVTKGWSEAYGLFLRGEADMVLSYTTSPAYHIIEEKKDQYAEAIFSEGHYQQVEVAGQLVTSKQPFLANCFMKFILTPAFQKAIPTGNWMYPVTDIMLPAGFTKPPLQISNFTQQEVAVGRSGWISDWQQAISR